MPLSSGAINLRVYCWTVAVTALCLVTAVVIMNYAVDPYYIHQWDTELLHRLSPAQQKIVPWAKTYAAYRYQPEIVYLGSSRAEIGLPTNFELFKGKRVFNLALSGGTPDDAVDLLKHTSFLHRPEIVVWGVEYGWLFADVKGNTDFNRSLMATGSFYPLWRALLNVKRSLALDMARDAVKILAGLSEQTCLPILASYGQKSEQCLESIMNAEGGAAEAFAKAMKNGSKADPPDFAISMEQVAQGTLKFCQYGTAFRIFIQPNHALSELQHIPQWEDRENWERALVALIDARRQQGCDIRLVDFSGFNSITTEPIPQQTGKKTMQYYWEQSHYRSEVGEKILAKLFSPDLHTEPSDFGVELNGSVIEQHLKSLRNARDRYIETHPQEAKHFQAKKSMPEQLPE